MSLEPIQGSTTAVSARSAAHPGTYTHTHTHALAAVVNRKCVNAHSHCSKTPEARSASDGNVIYYRTCRPHHHHHHHHRPTRSSPNSLYTTAYRRGGGGRCKRLPFHSLPQVVQTGLSVSGQFVRYDLCMHGNWWVRVHTRVNTPGSVYTDPGGVAVINRSI